MMKRWELTDYLITVETDMSLSSSEGILMEFLSFLELEDFDRYSVIVNGVEGICAVYSCSLLVRNLGL